MLLSDGCPNTTEDLRVYESGILDVASTEFIDLKVKLDLSTAEISENVIDILLDRPVLPGWPWGDPQGAARRTIGVSDVVVTSQLKRWHALHTLAVVYRDAFNNQLNDRYQAKFTEYSNLEREAREHTIRFGIGLVYHPIPRAARPDLSLGPGTGSDSTYYVQIAWVDPAGADGAPSAIATIGGATGQSPIVMPGTAPAGIAGYNVFAGLAVEELTLQNTASIALGESFTIAGLTNSGRAPSGGQNPDVYVTLPRISRRG